MSQVLFLQFWNSFPIEVGDTDLHSFNKIFSFKKDLPN